VRSDIGAPRDHQCVLYGVAFALLNGGSPLSVICAEGPAVAAYPVERRASLG
jgi:hypothetical protein